MLDLPVPIAGLFILSSIGKALMCRLALHLGCTLTSSSSEMLVDNIIRAFEVQDCDISSATGSGVGLEGGQLTVSGCRIHRCKQHGIALFNSLDGGEGAAL